VTEQETLQIMVDYLTELEKMIREERQHYESQMRDILHAQA